MSWIYRHWLRKSLLFFLGLLLCLWLGEIASEPFSTSVKAAEIVSGTVDEGLQNYQAGRFLAAIAIWEKALSQASAPEKAILYTNLGQAYRQIGKPDRAIACWNEAIKRYQADRQTTNPTAIAQLLTEQAQAYNDLGQHQVAIERAETAIQQAQKNQDPNTEAAAQGSLGNAHWSLGNFDLAFSAHEKGMMLACRIQNTAYTAIALNNLGNVFASRSDRLRYQATNADLEGDIVEAAALTQQANRDLQLAIAAYQKSIETSRGASSGASSGAGSVETNALLNLNRMQKLLPSSYSPPQIPELSCEKLNITSLATLSQPIPEAIAQPSQIQQPTKAPPANNGSPKPIAPDARQQSRTQILAQLESTPDSQDKAYGYINLANTLMQGEGATQTNLGEIKQLLEKAIAVTRNIQDARAESFALGTLGRVYEINRQYDQAADLTRQAQFVSQKVNVADSLYRWQWQMGRIFRATGQIPQAIAAYEQAIATLQSIRSDIIIANKDLQFDFRDSVEPVYRELIGLLLTNPPPAQPRASLSFPTNTTLLASTSTPHLPPPPSPLALAPAANVEKVLSILELLKLAELQDFFGDDCVQVAKEGIRFEQKPAQSSGGVPSLMTSKTAVVYSIVLEDQSYLILRRPDGSLKQYPILLADNGQPQAAGREVLQGRIDQLRSLLEKRSTDEYLTEAQAIYNALIRPLEADLQAIKPATLVFVSDGVLRKVPMAALHDGNQFLIEKYPIAITPSLSLTSRRPLNRENLQALVMGLTLEQPPYAALPNVGTEVLEVQNIMGGARLVDQEFTLKGMKERLKKSSYSIIHMATHGKFGVDAENTYLLTYGDRLTIDKLDEILRNRRSENPVELLTLSACQTAAGDNRSALGIAGVAVRAGVKSALATLWFINDEATVPLIEEFYTQLLKPGTSKAEALQRAQVKLIGDRQYSHPAVWSPFILIGNWM